ncbi:kinesin motor catalytic domain protein (macronuclear) [Tetrahymena thermophila SB210]|uniref:Kinesin motor catalytic domain protein n=1 Tax=Tetrahymena thermophila (strain SB210) TaxID=312017 RepID=I7LVY1_TETTS|nr:kinesin motor catalytic domain protein [Tetrahymena thermophila SB210]EAS00321.3 kinesin motor catalytic domain protein [Tetrahymena thermophila SB210]|eukprot:XP_001020566.3 kinesin motor catalytic domain protein [Tetrahymena thermophila SB210]
MSFPYQNIIKGNPIRTLVRVIPPSNFQREDVKIMANTISLTDSNQRIIEEHDCQEVYGPETDVSTMFQNLFRGHITPLVMGYNITIFTFGSTGSGKSATLEGNAREAGLILQMADSLFNQLETRKHHSSKLNQGNFQNYSYGVRVRYVEIIDEEITDLLGNAGNQFSDALIVKETVWEGPTIQNATVLTVQNQSQLSQLLTEGRKRRNQTSNEFGKLSSKATSIFTIELIQTQELVNDSAIENVTILSRLNFFDLPGSEIMLDDPESIRVRQGSTLNKSIIALTTLLRDMSQNQSKDDYFLTETSTVTHMMKDALGGNSISIGIFCLKNGDPKGSSYTLNMMKRVSNIQNFSIVNDGKAIGLLKRYRAEAIAASSNNRLGGYNMPGIEGELGNQKLQDLERRLIEKDLDKIRLDEERQRFASKLTEMREKYNQLIRDKGDLQSELIKSEEEKLEVSKALVELQIENTRLMEIIQTEKYESSNKLLNADGELLELKIKEEKALEQIQKLQDRLKEVIDDKRELEIEFVALKKNYIEVNKKLDDEKIKNQNVGMELINMVNENKALHDEMNDIYKKSSSTNDENARFINRIEKLENENQEQREALVFAKAEIERLKTEMLKYDILEQQHRIDIDNKKIEMEKGFFEITREKQNEFNKLTQEVEGNLIKNKDERLLWESQKMELTHKNKLQSRKIQELEERLNELMKFNDEMTAENGKLQLQLDEMRSVYRNKLIQFTSEQARGANGDKPIRIGYDMNAREELIRSYNEKEIQLSEQLEKEKRLNKNLKMEIRSLKNYARQMKYLAEDWAPVGVPLPEILKKDAPTQLDDEMLGGALVADQNVEIDRLRKRNRKLEEELRIIQDQLLNQTNKKADKEVDIQQRLLNEIEYMKSTNVRPGSSSQNIEILRKERNDLYEENKKLIAMLKDNRKWDAFILQKENERLMKQIKQYEDGQSIAPISGDSGMLKTKVQFNSFTPTKFFSFQNRLCITKRWLNNWKKINLSFQFVQLWLKNNLNLFKSTYKRLHQNIKKKSWTLKRVEETIDRKLLGILIQLNQNIFQYVLFYILV